MLAGEIDILRWESRMSADERAPCPTLLVEDHPLMRETLREFLTETASVDLIGMVSSAEEALQFCEQQVPRLALIDVSLPGMNGLDLVTALRGRYPGIWCVMLSGHRELSYIERAKASGAHGYVLKGDPGELLRGVSRVIDGGTYFSDITSAGRDAPGSDQ
jgi:DNA-binding NarL/FixJ family response regulator